MRRGMEGEIVTEREGERERERGKGERRELMEKELASFDSHILVRASQFNVNLAISSFALATCGNV